jgi:hypothetical protein
MQLLILLVIAFILGYWLANRYHPAIQNSVKKSTTWMKHLFRRGAAKPDGELIEERNQENINNAITDR